MYLTLLVLLSLLIGTPTLKSFAAIESKPFVTTINGETSPFSIRTVMVLPGEKLTMTAEEEFDVEGPGEFLSEDNGWSWVAPLQTGHYSFVLRPENEDSEVLVNAFVTVPYERMKKGFIKNFRIGEYREGEGAYERPSGFIEVTEENKDTWLSPHFQLKQFLCKQAGGYPKYVIVQERLLIKLEMILKKLRSIGFPARTLTVMSGFRTPAYNRSLGNVKNSRHLFGDAADIFVDSKPLDNRMDDLNRDGKLNHLDSLFLRDLVEDLEQNTDGLVPVGGVGTYANSHTHGPFVHVDARGHVARWKGNKKAKRVRLKKRPRAPRAMASKT